MAMGDDPVSAGFGDGDYPGEPGGDLGEKDSRAGDGVEGSGVWRKPQAPNGIGELAARVPRNVGDMRDRLPEDMALSDMSSEAGYNRAKRSPDLATKEVAMNPTPNDARFPTAPVSVEGLQKEVEKLKKEKQVETNWAMGFFMSALVLVFVCLALSLHVGYELFNHEEVDRQIAAVMQRQPVTSLETLAADTTLREEPTYWYKDYGVIVFNYGGNRRWVKLSAQDYDDLNAHETGALKECGGVRDGTFFIAVRDLLDRRKAQSAQSSNAQKPVPISAVEPKTDNNAEQVADPPKPSDAKATEGKPANDDAEWKRAAEGPYATLHDLSVVYDYVITECRDGIAVAEVMDGGNAVQYLHLKPLLYISFKLHESMGQYDNNVRAVVNDFTEARWIAEHQQMLNDKRLFAIAAQMPVLTGKEIYDGIPHPSWILRCDDATNVIHILDGTSFDERFIRVDKRWYEMFKAEVAQGGYYVLQTGNHFADKYGYNEAKSDKPYVEPKPVDPVDELRKKVEELNGQVEELKKQKKGKRL